MKKTKEEKVETVLKDDELVDTPTEYNNIPPFKIERNEYGLLKNLNYVFDENGMVDWRAMIPVKYLYINPDKKRRKEIEDKYGKPYDQIDILLDKVEDRHLVSMLGGTKYLARIRGVKSVKVKIKESNESYASVTATIVFIPNYETESKEFTYSENACAHSNNTYSFAQQYLVEMATNRAVCRAIRMALSIFVVSQVEVSGAQGYEERAETSSSVSFDGQIITNLKNKCEAKNISIQKLIIVAKEKWLSDLEGNPDEWKTFEDIPKRDIYTLTGKVGV